MNTAGWIFICLSWGAIIGLLIFCINRLTSKDKKQNDTCVE
jgi:hypothetical protein